MAELVVNGITIHGEVKDRKRLITGIYSLDKAFENAEWKEVGVPLATMELYGPTGCGKTTLSWFLAAETAKMVGKGITFFNIEVFDYRYLTSCLAYYGFQGDIDFTEGETDEAEVDYAESSLKGSLCDGAYVLDSVGAVSPVAELEGDAGAANMGRRAKLMAAHVRVLNHITRHKDLLCVFINHVHPNIGRVGSHTTGGETIGYHAANRVRVKRKEEFKDGSFSMEGKVIKNRFGLEDRLFWVFVLGGRGIHKGMSAVYDCVQLGLLKKAKGERSYKWTDSGEKILSYANLIEAARCNDVEIFVPFIDALNANGVVAQGDKEEEGDDE